MSITTREEVDSKNGVVLLRHSPNENLVEELRELLGQAERGEIHSIAIAAIGPGKQYDLVNFASRPIELLGSVMLVQQRLVDVLNKRPTEGVG